MSEVLKMKKLDLNKLKSVYYSGGMTEDSEFDYGASKVHDRDDLTPNEEL